MAATCRFFLLAVTGKLLINLECQYQSFGLRILAFSGINLERDSIDVKAHKMNLNMFAYQVNQVTLVESHSVCEQNEAITREHEIGR